MVQPYNYITKEKKDAYALIFKHLVFCQEMYQVTHSETEFCFIRHSDEPILKSSYRIKRLEIVTTHGKKSKDPEFWAEAALLYEDTTTCERSAPAQTQILLSSRSYQILVSSLRYELLFH